MIYLYDNQLIAKKRWTKKQNMSFNDLLSKNSDWSQNHSPTGGVGKKVVI